MWIPIVTGLVVALQAAGAGARPQDWQPPVLLAAPLVSSDGSLAGPAASITADGAQFFISTPEGSCHAEISTAPPLRPREGWQVSARVTHPQFGAATVVVEWQRRWSGGLEVAGGTQARMEVGLRSPERLALDQIQTVAPGLPCHGRPRRLELSLLDGAKNSPPALPISPLPTPMRVELWLIHDRPNQPRGQNVTHMSQSFDPAGTQSMFRTAVFTSGGKSFTVDVDTHFRVVREELGRIGLWVGLRRIILDGETGALQMAGASSDIVAWGGPGEVLEFELPAPGVRVGGESGGSGRGSVRGGSASGSRGATTPALLQGHQFSVRVRFTPGGS